MVGFFWSGSLEILALARHCRFGEAQKIALQGVAEAKRFSKNYNELRKSIELFSFNESVPEKNKEIPIKNRGKFDRDLSWKLSKKQLLSLSHPRSLRVKVKSQCL